MAHFIDDTRAQQVPARGCLAAASSLVPRAPRAASSLVPLVVASSQLPTCKAGQSIGVLQERWMVRRV